MKTNLPETRNRNLPPPPAHAASVESRRRMMPPASPDEPNRGASALRSFLAMLVIAGLLFAGIWFYLRGSESDLKVREQIFRSLRVIGAEIWETAGSALLTTDSGERQKDFEDLPRVISGVRAWTRARGMLPRIVPVEVDTLSSRGNATHQIQYFFGDSTLLIIRVHYHGDTGNIGFIGVANGVNVASRQDLLESAPPADPAQPPPAVAPAPAPAPVSPAEKVSEPPANPP